jgi:glycosyltransferase involved in cell wall biosynthesis
MLWFPSFSEGFGLPIVEAMASGTPVVTSGVSCMPEIAGDAALFIDPANPTSIAFAAQLILNDPEVAARLSANGRKRAALFTWDSAIKKTVEVYHEVEEMI